MRSSRLFAVLVPLLILTLFALPLQAQGSPGIPIDQGLWALTGTDPNLPQDDLEPLRQILGGAELVGLGESFHMSGGFYRMKDRVFRFLVQEMGFRAFGIESSWIRADLVEQYVQTCQGTPEDALLGLFDVWNSTETRDLVRWMCEWNTAHPGDRVHFYGFDNQSQTRRSADALIAFLQRIGMDAGDPRIAGIRACDGAVDRYYPSRPFPPELYQQCQDALSAVAALFDGQEKAIESQTSQEDLAWARIHIVGQQSWQEQIFYRRTDFYRSYAARDRGMAYAAREIRRLRFPHARTVLWAHNGHIVENGGPASPFVLTTMGTFLGAEPGNKYFTIALVAFNTGIDWGEPGLCGQIDLVGPSGVERVFQTFGRQPLLADLGAKGGRPPFLEPGALYSLADFPPMVLGNHFDAVIYLEDSPAATPLLWEPGCQF